MHSFGIEMGETGTRSLREAFARTTNLAAVAEIPSSASDLSVAFFNSKQAAHAA